MTHWRAPRRHVRNKRYWIVVAVNACTIFVTGLVAIKLIAFGLRMWLDSQ